MEPITIKGVITVIVKDHKDHYINATGTIKDNIFVVDTDDHSIIYPLQNITKIIYRNAKDKK